MNPAEMKTIRKDLGLTQAELADALDITATYIGMMERGLKRIERRTELSVLYLADQKKGQAHG